MSKKALRFSFTAFLFLFVFMTQDLFSQEKALSYLRELAFEVNRYNITGHSPLPESVALSKISKVGTRLFSRHKFDSSAKRFVYLCEFYYPEKTGIIDSTFCDEDLYSVSEDYSDFEEEEGEKSFDWVDQVILGLYVPEGFVRSPSQSVDYGMIDGEKLLEILEKGDSRGLETEGEEVSDAPKEFTYAKNDGSLRRFLYDGEQFTVWNEGDNTILVNFYGDKLIRKNFDFLYRLVRTEQYKLAASAKNMSLVNLTEYDYYSDSNILEKSVEQDFNTKKRVERHFNEKGLNVLSLESHYEERDVKTQKKKNGDESQGKETLLLDDIKRIKAYDEKGRLYEEEVIFWNYKKNLMGRYLTEERKTKNIFDYSAVTDENKLPPNLKFYENDELHLERKFSTSGNYSERLYFEDGFSVEVFYEDGLRKTEIIYQNDKEQRRREFDY